MMITGFSVTLYKAGIDSSQFQIWRFYDRRKASGLQILMPLFLYTGQKWSVFPALR